MYMMMYQIISLCGSDFAMYLCISVKISRMSLWDLSCIYLLLQLIMCYIQFMKSNFHFLLSVTAGKLKKKKNKTELFPCVNNVRHSKKVQFINFNSHKVSSIDEICHSLIWISFGQNMICNMKYFLRI